MIMEEKIIEINVSLSYKEEKIFIKSLNTKVFIKSLNTNEMPAELLFNIMRRIESDINFYFKKDKKDE